MTFHVQKYIGWKLQAISVVYCRKIISPSSYLRYDSTCHTNSVFRHGAWTGENDDPDHKKSMQHPFLCGCFDMISILVPTMLRETEIALPLLYHLNQIDGATPRKYRQPKKRMWLRPRNHKARLSQLLGPAMMPTAGEADVLAGPGISW